MKLIPSSAAIREACVDFGDSAEHARRCWGKVEGLSQTKAHWEGTCLRFLTESIHPRTNSPTRPRVMLLFSNPHPESVNTGLFMSEKNSRQFWEMLCSHNQLGVSHDFRWDADGVDDTVSLLLNGDYGDDNSPLLFFDCLYPIPSRSPKDLKRLFAEIDDFERYLHRPSLERIGAILTDQHINTVLTFTGETYESIADKPGISKHSREILFDAVKTRDKVAFWASMDKHQLRTPVALPGLTHGCTAVKLMDTRAKHWWLVEGRSVFSHALGYALRYAAQAG